MEQYLPECIESLVKQKSDSIDNYEILLIDDGSTDRSPELCDFYDSQYSQIHAFHKNNGGLSDARNYGIDHSTGDYLIFIDSDDWIAPNALKTFSRALADQPADVLITRLTEVYPEKVIQNDRSFETYLQQPLTKERALEWEMIKSQNTWPAVKTIVSHRLIEDNQIRFMNGMLHEDMDWTAHICMCADTYIGSGIEWYYHRMMRSGSITSSIKGKNITDTVKIAGKFFEETKDDHSYKAKLIRKRMMRSVYAKLNELKKCTLEEQKDVIHTVKENKRIFAVAPGMKYKVFVMAMKLIGPKAAISILNRING